MAKIPLRAYNREIESLIEQNQLEQAIAHARHILKFFPKHVNTYRLLGKAYLESQRYGDAADVFQRVLSSIPDDFISHVGMSIIREDEANLDHAIWHMERAFEVQPANSAIQGELRRLYGRRDGMEPPKVRLSRSALARMYIKGELYQQAITEVRAALAEDPQRPDLLSLLAQAYFLSGQRVEAANACSTLLKKTPYSLEGNRILAEILGKAERPEEAQVYRQRALALEPYTGHTSPAAPTPDQVPETAVTLEKLVWSPGQQLTSTQEQPEWAASLGVELESAAPVKEGLPEWLSEQPESKPSITSEAHDEEGVVPPETPAPSPETPSTELPEDAIPDWMKEVGWQPASGEAEEPVKPLEEAESVESASDELAPAQIPDWLQSIAPGEKPELDVSDETGEPTPPSEEPLADSEALSWLEETPPGPSDTIGTWLEEKQPLVPDMLETDSEPEEESDIPEWLQELGKTPSTTEEVEPTEELPDWLRQPVQDEWQPSEPPEITPPEIPTIPPAEEAPTLSESDEITWLEDLAGKQGVEGVQLTPEDELIAPPEWALEAASEAPAELEIPLPEEPPTAEDLPTGPLSEALTEISGLDTEDSQTLPQAEPAELPDWLRELGTEPEADEIIQPESELEGGLLGFDEGKAEITEPTEWISETEAPVEMESEPTMLFSPQEIPAGSEIAPTVEEVSESEAETFDISDTQPTRLQLEREEPELASDETAIPTLESLDDEIPDWLRGLGEEQLTAETLSELTLEELPTEIIEQEAAVEEPLEPEVASAETILDKSPEAGVPLDDEDAFAWLESLAARQGAQEALLLEPEERLETPPDWVQKAAEEEQLTTVTPQPSDVSPPVEAVPEEEFYPETQFEEAILPEPTALESAPSIEELLEEAPTSLESALEEPVLESLEPTPTEVEAVETPPDLPSWLTEVERAETIEAETGWAPPVEMQPEAAFEEEALVPAEQPVEAAPFVLDLNEAGLAELERLPGVGFTRAQAVINYRQENGPFTSVEDLINVSGFGEFLVDTLKDKIKVVEAQPAEVVPEAVGDNQVILIQARNALIQGNISEALTHYRYLIKEQQLLPEVIQDLNEALYRFPVDVSIWEALGEAHLRAGRLQDALDALTKAEELIR